MSEIEVYEEELRQKISDFLVPIQTSRVVSETNFKSVQQALEQIASELKDINIVSKSLLNDAYVTIKILRAEAPHFNEDESNVMVHMANKLEIVFELILKNETIDQRKPGVPRIL
jgi:hypothetical protein